MNAELEIVIESFREAIDRRQAGDAKAFRVNCQVWFKDSEIAQHTASSFLIPTPVDIRKTGCSVSFLINQFRNEVSNAIDRKPNYFGSFEVWFEQVDGLITDYRVGEIAKGIFPKRSKNGLTTILSR